MFLNYLLKPFSPHLTIYNIQSSSFFSIFQRITGIIFLFFIYYILIFYLVFLNIYLIKYIFCGKLLNILFSFSKNFFFILIIFHIINGLKIILWNFNYLIKFSNVSKIHNFIIIILLLTMII
uniref:succinate dehydrogenase subunit 3 n=1 Tax=Polysiphonia morrowii TaxID=173542 RepID=UPI002E7900DE|nr:succinate dehydrogenase subunit 3 [Polysiphonia morrowii]WQF69606.1 succinate dehydrogenase subunit 3 [Polysiphonia morrowii]